MKKQVIKTLKPVCPACGSNKIVDRKNWTGQESVGYTLCIACGHKFDEFRNQYKKTEVKDMYLEYLIKLYNSLYKTDAVAYRGTLGSLKIMILKEMEDIKT